jgi:hypothetical protein
MPDELQSPMSLCGRIRPPLSGWLGGKSRLAARIIERMPEHKCYVEPFAGAAWVLFRKQESTVEVLNDINKEIITLYRCLQWHLEEFLRYFKWVLVSRDEFERLKRAVPDTLTDIQRAARFFYLQQSCYGGRVNNPTFGYPRDSVAGPEKAQRGRILRARGLILAWGRGKARQRLAGGGDPTPPPLPARIVTENAGPCRKGRELRGEFTGKADQ